jgi:orotidine-5'-phosphate decarboxylase
MIQAQDRLIVALDVSSASEARKIVQAVGDSARLFKVGKQLFTAEGPQVVRDLICAGRRVFLDLKYHDIPTTVAAAVGEATKLGVSMLTVHASGGEKMLKAAVEAAFVRRELAVLAVTVLTSMDQHDLEQVGVSAPLRDQVCRLGALALAQGCAGLVSSAREARTLRQGLGNDFLIVTPGVRPTGSAKGDQARVVTPAEAIAAGVTHIVVGRPIANAPDPAKAARDIVEEMMREAVIQGH